MKKLLTLLICALLCLTLIACGGECAHNDADGNGTCDACGNAMGTTPPSDDCTSHTDANKDGKCDNCGASTAIVPAEDKVELVKGGAAQFQVVMDTETAAKNIALVKSAIDKINLRLETGAEMIAEAQSTEMTYEILIGSVASRGDAYAFDKHDYGAKGYIVKIVGSKVCVVAGSDDALEDALTDMLKTFFGIKNNKVTPINELTLTADDSIDKTQSDYPVSSVTVENRDVNDFAIVVNKASLATVAKDVQSQLYYYLGLWLEICTDSELAAGQGAIRLNIIEKGSEASTHNGYDVFVENGDLIIASEFENKIYEATIDFINTKIIKSNKNSVNFKSGAVYTKNVRDIYYSEFDAKGDGRTDDFMAIKAAHDYANQYGHIVHANAGATYYFGKGSGRNTITIKTDTYWHGCKFIFDDSEIKVGSAEYATSIFSVLPDEAVKTYGEDNPIGSVTKGATNVGWAPGYKAMIVIYNDNVRHYIRYGLNANNGSSQRELIIIEPDGSVDPSTPIQWTYETITSMELYRIDDTPITISGADDGEYAEIHTIFNGAASKYNYYKRNIEVSRSNVYFKNIKHTMSGEIPESEGGTGAPYDGFTKTINCNNVTYDNFIYHKLRTYHLETDKNNNMGSYEIAASMANNITWKNGKQDVFFEEDGSIKFKGIMGTNFCKNLVFDNMFICSFDAHQGVYNTTIRNSTLEHINFIGDGTIILENVKVYADGIYSAINLREDYGSTWRGDLIINGLDIMYSHNFNESIDIRLVNAKWNNHFFGYDTYLPQNIVMNNVRLLKYEYGIANGLRYEKIIATNEKELLIFPAQLSNLSAGIGDKILPNGEENKNVNVATKSITVTNSDLKNPLKISWPTSPHFNNTKITVDGEEIR